MQILPSFMDGQSSRLRFRLVIVLGLLASVLGALVYRDHQKVLAGESQRLGSLARVAEENLGRQLEALATALQGVREDLPFFASGRFQESLSRRLAALSAALPGVRTLLVVDADGIVLASNRPGAVGQSVAQRPYFKQLKVQADPQTLYLSEPFTTTSNIFSMNAIKVVTDSEGRFSGLIAATLDPEHFDVLLRSLLYAPDMRATLVHGDGKLFMSLPPNEASLGKNLAVPGSNFSAHRSGGSMESMTTASTYTLGERRLTAWRNVQPQGARMDKPLVLAIGRQLDETLAPWRKTAAFYGVVYVLVSALAFIALNFVQRRRRMLIDDARTREDTARKNAERVDLALAGASLGIWDVDLLANHTTVNARYQEMLGEWNAQGFATLQDLLAKIHPEDLESVEEAFERAQQSADGVFDMELRMRHRDGHWVWIHSMGKVTERDAHGRALRATGTHLDISDRKATEAQIWDMAFYDPLTRLPNRRLLLDRIAQARIASERSGQTAAVMFLDLDRFKELNDSRGHAAGDTLLREVAVRLIAGIRQSDTVARLGGDEFVVLLQNLDEQIGTARQQAQAVAEKALQALQVPYELEGGDFSLSASIGVMLFKGRECTVEQILEQADQAMYRAKRAGRNVLEICETPQIAGQVLR